jgi:hypothetical protein
MHITKNHTFYLRSPGATGLRHLHNPGTDTLSGDMQEYKWHDQEGRDEELF